MSPERKRAKTVTYSVDNKSSQNDPLISDVIKGIISKQHNLPAFEAAKSLVKKYGAVEAFVVNTHMGTKRVSNEDRVSVLLNAQVQYNKEKYGNKSSKNFSLFSVFDGHGGVSCCNYLRDHLHNSIVDNLNPDVDTNISIKQTYNLVDDNYIKESLQNNKNFAGSCSITLMVTNDTLLVINTGDSRAVLSANSGSQTIEASTDHKPDLLSEFDRVIEAGAELYKIAHNNKTGQNSFYFAKNKNYLQRVTDMEKSVKNMQFGPWRVSPGGLAIARSFGDLESKLTHLGGIPGSVIAEPDITEFSTKNLDFALIACKLNS